MKTMLSKALFIFFMLIPYQIFAQVSPEGNFIGPIPPKNVDVKGDALDSKGITSQNIISGVPPYIWFRGCGPTSMGMIFGYYDTHGFPDMMPGDGSYQSDEVDQTMASDEHYDDYAIPLDDEDTGILPDKSELPVGDEHPDNCIADYLKTSQSIRGNLWMWTLPVDIKPGWENYISEKLPDYEGSSSAYDFNSFPWDSLVANIDRNRPMMFLVDSDADGVYDHYVCVIGYQVSDGTNEYICLNTWDDTYGHAYPYVEMAPGEPFGVLNAFTFEVHYKLPASAGPISGPASVCKDQPGVNYSVPVIAGADSYIWTLPSGATGSSTTNTISVNFGSGAVSGNITVKGHNSNGDGDPSSLSVVVSVPLTDPGAISGLSSVCQGSSQTYSISTVSGAISYSWTLPSGWSGSSTTNSIDIVAGSTGGAISVAAVNGCGNSNPSTLNVSVTTVPARPASITGNTTVCQGTEQTYSIAPVTGATSYIWTLPDGWTGSSSSESITATVGSSGGTIMVTANNMCGSGSSRSLSVSVIPLVTQPGIITGETMVCQSSEQTYSVAPVSGATSYIWTLPSGWSGSSSSESLTATVGSNGGIISVMASNSCGSGDVRTLTVTVSAPPAQPGSISGSSSICEGTMQTYSISPVSGATSYTWTLPSGWSGNSTTESISTTVGSESGNISVTANNDCGPGEARVLPVTVSHIPQQPGDISGNITVCQGSINVYSISPVEGAVSYQWTLPSGWNGSSTTESITAVAGSSGGFISVKAVNSCGISTSKSMSLTVNIAPSQPGTISGATSVCEGSVEIYSISSISGASSYSWILPSGWSGNSSTSSISATPGSTGGAIYVSAKNACGTSTPQSLTVNSTALPGTAGTISGITTVCQGQEGITYSVPSIPGATSYYWILPQGVNGTSSTNTITVDFGSSATSGNIYVNGYNSCGSGNQSSLYVTVNATPAIPFITLNDNILHSNSSFGNQWYFTDGAIAGATGQNYTPTKQDDYYVIVTSGGCSSEKSNSIYVLLTGIESSYPDNMVKIYPNPVVNQLIIEKPGNLYELKYEILNSMGQVLKQGTLVNKTTVNTENLSRGIYILKIENSRSFDFIKIVKE